MILTVTPHIVTNIPQVGDITTTIEHDGRIIIFDSNGTTVLNKLLSEVAIEFEDNEPFYLKDTDGYAVEVNYKATEAVDEFGEPSGVSVYPLIFDIKAPYVFTQIPIGIRIENNANGVFYKMFNFFGYDYDLPLYILSSALQSGNQTLSSFTIINNPLNNIKNIYKNNNSKATAIKYYFDNHIVSTSEDFSKEIDNDVNVHMWSEYVWIVYNQIFRTTHTSAVQNLYKFQFHPDVYIEKNYTDDNLQVGQEVELLITFDFTNQVKFYIDGNEHNLGRNNGIEVNVYDKANTLVSSHKELHYMLGVPVPISTSCSFTSQSNGEHRIEVNYSILGREANRHLTKYSGGINGANFIIAYSDDEAHPIGDILSLAPNEELPKTSTFVLIPCYVTTSELTYNMYYNEPYTNEVIPNTGQVVLHTIEYPLVIPQVGRVSPVVSVFNYLKEDTINILDRFDISQRDTNTYIVSNLTDEDLYIRLNHLVGEEFETGDIETLSDSKTLTLEDGIYQLEISSDNQFNKEPYYRVVLLPVYGKLIGYEIDFINMLMNDCIGKTIDYRNFYDFTAFNFLTNIFYKLLVNSQTFYYIYSDTIPDSILKQLYSADEILKRLNEYVANYDRKRN